MENRQWIFRNCTWIYHEFHIRLGSSKTFRHVSIDFYSLIAAINTHLYIVNAKHLVQSIFHMFFMDLVENFTDHMEKLPKHAIADNCRKFPGFQCILLRRSVWISKTYFWCKTDNIMYKIVIIWKSWFVSEKVLFLFVKMYWNIVLYMCHVLNSLSNSHRHQSLIPYHDQFSLLEPHHLFLCLFSLPLYSIDSMFACMISALNVLLHSQHCINMNHLFIHSVRTNIQHFHILMPNHYCGRSAIMTNYLIKISLVIMDVTSNFDWIKQKSDYVVTKLVYSHFPSKMPLLTIFAKVWCSAL